MEKEILNKIKSYQTIIIHRHKNPDLDAFGSQLGLKEVIETNFPEKNVYAVGDVSDAPYYIYLDVIKNEVYHDALAIIVDTAASSLVSDERYKLAKELIVIDHHLNDTDVNPNIFYRKEQYVSCAEIIADLTIQWQLKLNHMSSTYLLSGIIGDSGRYQYINDRNAEHVFRMSAELSKYKPDIKLIYDFLLLEPLAKKKARQIFSDFELTKHNVAYRFNDQALIDRSGLDFTSVSRGMINLMAGIKEVPIWVSFTENEEGYVIAEIRSRDISVVDIAKKFGGGGHANACGATLKDFEVAKKMLEDLDERAIK